MNKDKCPDERLAVNTVNRSNDIDNSEKEEPQSLLDLQPDSSDTVTIMYETFEGVFPPITGGGEIIDANPNDGEEYYWDDDNLRPFNGLWAAWPARGGANGIDPTLSTSYPNYMDTWMIYGPFDLSNAKSAQVAFMLWRHIEVNWDRLFFGISSDGITFNGWRWDGDLGWKNKAFSLGPYLGDNSVWIGWHFVSDGSVQYDGPWIDDIILDFIPGDITIEGSFTYADRSSIMRGAKGIKVQL